MNSLSSKRKFTKKSINDRGMLELSKIENIDMLSLLRRSNVKAAAICSKRAAMYDKEIRRRRKLARLAP